MPFPDVRVQIGTFAAAHCGDEVLEVVCRTFPFLDLLAILVEGGCAAVVRDEDVTPFTFDHYRDCPAFVLIHVLGIFLLRQTAHFEDQRSLRKLVPDDLCVRRFGIILISKPATHADDAPGQFVHTEEPSRDVHLMNSLVAEVTISVEPEPMPVIMDRPEVL